MKFKKEYLILVAVIVALSLYVGMRDRDRTHYKLPELPKLEAKKISKIEIQKPDMTMVLTKNGTDWVIGDEKFPTDSKKAKDLVDVIEKMTLTAMVSESKNYIRYDLGEKKKIRVKVFQGATLKREFALGKSAGSYQHTFVRIEGDDKVYHARGNFRNDFDRSVDDFRDKKVLSFDIAAIKAVSLTKGDETISLSHAQPPVSVNVDGKGDTTPPTVSPAVSTDAPWKDENGKDGDAGAVKTLLNTLSNLSCDAYLKNGNKDDLNEPIARVTLKGDKEYTVSIFAKSAPDADQYPAISSDNAYPFFLSTYTAENIMKDPATLYKEKEVTK